MANNKGKQFETSLKKYWSQTVADSWIYRLYDTTAGFKGIRNISDFIAFKSPIMYVLEAKSTLGNTFSCSFRQYNDLKCLNDEHISNMEIGVVIWFRDHAKCIYVPISTFTKLIDDGKKSFNIKMLGDQTYPHIEITSKKLRTNLQLDFLDFTAQVEVNHAKR